MLFMKLRSYLREAYFIISATGDLRSRAILLLHTFRFHLFNALKRAQDKDATFTINLAIDRGHVGPLILRTFAGDLFVLYEVLLDCCYFIPNSYLAPNTVRAIIDCGANIGITALYFASRYPNAKIYCVEPHPENFAILKQNVQFQSRIIPIHAAVVAQPNTSVRLSVDEPAWGNKLSQKGEGIDVPAITVSEICEKYGLQDIDLLKVDIEGAEEAMFADAGFLSRVKAGIIELHGQYSKQRFDKDLTKWGFVSFPPEPEKGLKMLTFGRAASRNLKSDPISSFGGDSYR
jgi:FkbM family methyltransferase